MLKKIFSISAIAFITITSYGQEVKKEAETAKTKMDVFASKTGSITKFVDTKLPNLKTSYDATETRIRKISNGALNGYFYQLVKEGKYSNTTASIEYTDLIEVLKAIKVLKENVTNDITANPDYMENKFVTVDGFQVGYFVSKGKASWYIKLEKYGSDNTLFIDNGDIIENAFNEAKNKIDELKK
ncbi:MULTISPECIES: hypothetical protein [Chryseobacterium]|uniref:Uncharacterized protein n=2 Tax=Chryseobacterium TaxID=59732 RepID=A0A1I4VWM5_CHROL|nr:MULTISPECIES: hypothetical protein [Chryseobacterium]MCT2561932.1 hypothetical protein [Chryseobacterium sp. pc1-10]SFN05416.1 hypothetical protein SAMN05421594_0672 [Chryseobacterium oleae]